MVSKKPGPRGAHGVPNLLCYQLASDPNRRAKTQFSVSMFDAPNFGFEGCVCKTFEIKWSHMPTPTVPNRLLTVCCTLYMYVCMYVYAHIYIYICISIYLSLYLSLSIYTYMYTPLSLYIHMYTQYVCVYVYIYIYIYIYTHTNEHIHSYYYT